MTTAKTYDRVEQYVSDSLPLELAGYAARAAASELLRNWNDAINDSNGMFSTESMLGDLDQTIELLGKIRAVITGELNDNSK
jgi:hypothetical protein